jgi:tRNA A37 threonylcarbamoyladenosine dehydratase
VGRLILMDPQRVELSNLNRQVLHWKGRGKVQGGVGGREATLPEPQA